MRSLVAVIQIGRPSVRQQNVRPRPETEAHSGMCSTLKPSQNLDDQNRLLEISQPSHSTRETGGLSNVGVGVAQADGSALLVNFPLLGRFSPARDLLL